ncbi:PP-loop family protein [gut metagenome]|uniref:PP-loop family protein n=1 Tax=gut metagenome TaxID=749906 RepID=J9GQ46_9ZZZZ
MEASVKVPRKLTEAYRISQTVSRKFREGIKEFGLIAEGDAILVGLSGGKDSMALLELLGEYRRYGRNAFRLYALHVRMEQVDYQSDAAYLSAFATACGAEYVERSVGFAPDRDPKRTPCFLCSWNRRKTLFEVAQELGCNKIALGHHQDDILKTALMNLTFNGTFATMPALLKMRKMPLVIIRPLCKVEEELLRQWAALKDYQPLLKHCPYEQASSRTQMDRVVEAMAQLNPEYRYNLWHALVKDGKLVE